MGPPNQDPQVLEVSFWVVHPASGRSDHLKTPSTRFWLQVPKPTKPPKPLQRPGTAWKPPTCMDEAAVDYDKSTFTRSADLGGRVGWLPKAERWGGRGGVGGGVSRLRFPPSPPSSRFSPRHPGPQQAPGPGPPLSPASRIFNLLLHLKRMGPGLKTQSADLERRWMVSEGGALQSHERRGSRLRSSISRWAGPKGLRTWATSR